jgi:hypothetical protein
LWSDRLIEIIIPNVSELHFRQGLFYGDLQRSDYDLGYRYTLTPKIKEDIEFQRGIIIELNSGNEFGTELISSVWTLGTNNF